MTMKPNPWRRIAITVSAMLIVLLIAASYRFVASRGIFTGVEDKIPASCRVVAGISGVRDIAVDGTGNTYLVAADGLYAFSNSTVKRLTGTPKNFDPSALAIGADGTFTVLFRQNGLWEVSVFAAPAPSAVKEIGRLSADILSDPAGLAVLPAGRLYFANRHTSRSAIGRRLDDTFLIPRAEVTWFDGMKFIPVAKRLNSPAGIAVSADGGRLYVAQELPRNIVSFTRNDFTGALSNAALFDLPAAPTKITMAKDGSLIVAAWPKQGAGAVYRVQTADGTPQSTKLLYSSKTEPVTAAAETNGHLLIGSPNRLLDCRL
jgi:DNA-binding beta-propeller fold protein YncE